MWRSIGAFIAGFVTWVAIASLAFFLMRILWPEYAVAEPLWAFTLPMQLSRLLLGVVSSIGAGYVVGLIAGRHSPAPWILGVVLLAIFTPFHIQLWDKFPVWYHLFFLIPLVPLVGLSARLIPQRQARVVAA